MTCTKCRQPIAMYHRTGNGPHHLACPPSLEAVRRLLVEADSALSLILYRKGKALAEIEDGQFVLEVETLIHALRRSTKELGCAELSSPEAHL